jgi:hypothetical protein
MSRLQACWRVGWRLAVCLLLLVWIFHSIFLSQGKADADSRGLDWSQLGRAEQWRLAWTTGPRELWRTLCLIQPAALAGSLACVLLTILLGVARWRIILGVQGLELRRGRATGICFVAQFFNSFLLGSTGGDVIKALYAARETHHKKAEAVVTVFVDRLIGLWAMLLFAVVMMLPNLGLLTRHRQLAVPALLIVVMLGGTSVVLGVAFWGGVSKRFPRARHWLRKFPKAELLERSLDSCRQFGRARGFLPKTIGLSILNNLACVLQLAVLSADLGAGVSFVSWMVIVPMIFCISALPITPSGLGVRENLFVMMLAVPEIGVARTTALSLSLLAFAGMLFWSLVGGVVYLGLKKKEHLEEVTQADALPEGG